MVRKPFTTTIEDTIQKAFKISCTEKDEKMNDVLEAFMQGYINDDFEIEKEIKLKIKKTK